MVGVLFMKEIRWEVVGMSRSYPLNSENNNERSLNYAK
nr:MAG TPA: hypothetical protein [Caudoviricetes sp.]DAY49528.1 MAG TPA: hypothetical protein [Caudoviricetes sp.]